MIFRSGVRVLSAVQKRRLVRLGINAVEDGNLLSEVCFSGICELFLSDIFVKCAHGADNFVLKAHLIK